MPRIPHDNYFPTERGISVGQGFQGFRADTSAPSPALADAAGRQISGFGAGLEKLGLDAMGVAADMQEQINTARVQDARNQLMQYRGALADDPKEGYLSKTGLDALKPQEGKSLADVYLDRYEKARDQVLAGLDNDAQRAMLTPHAADIGLQIQNEVQKHSFQQFRHYQLSTYNGQLRNAADDAARNWQDAQAVSSNVLQAMTAVANAGKMQDKAPQEILADARSAASTVHLRVLSSALESGDTRYARLYFDSHKDARYDEKGTLLDGGMLAPDIAAFQSHLTKANDLAASQTAIALTTRGMASRFAPTDMDRLTSLVMGAESAGKRYDTSGKLLEGPATKYGTAKGEMQVLDSTNKDPGFGVTPARDDTPAERARVGRDYLSALVQRYGELPKALAAYNWGPGNLDAAIKDKGDNWLASAPKETQAYVGGIMSKYAAGQGAPAMPTEQDYVAEAVQALGPNPRPELVKQTQAMAEHQYGLIDKSRKQQIDRVIDAGIQQLVANGGDFAALDQRIKTAVLTQAPEKYATLQATADKLNKEIKTADPTALNASLFHPERLAAMSDAEFRQWQIDNFPRGEWEAVAKRRDSYINGATDTSAGGLNHKALDLAANQAMVRLGIDPSPKHDDMANVQKAANIKNYLADAVLQQQAQRGQKMTEDEVRKFVDKTFATDISFQRTWFGGQPDPVKMMSLTANDLKGIRAPDDSGTAYDQIKSYLVGKGNKAPTDSDILRTYWRLKGA